jgi:hypothetical protein
MLDRKIQGLSSDCNEPTHARARHCNARMVVALALLAASSSGGAQQLLVNGDFDSDLSGWNVSDAPGTTWAAFDYAGASSGSARFTNDMPGADTASTNLTQCVVLAKPGRYFVSANGYLPAGQASGMLYVNAVLHLPSTTCQSFGSTPLGFYLPATIDAWSSQQGTIIELDDIDVLAGASIELRVGIQKTSAGGSIQGYIDGVRVIYDAVFVDGFEPPLAGN